MVTSPASTASRTASTTLPSGIGCGNDRTSRSTGPTGMTTPDNSGRESVLGLILAQRGRRRRASVLPPGSVGGRRPQYPTRGCRPGREGREVRPAQDAAGHAVHRLDVVVEAAMAGGRAAAALR